MILLVKSAAYALDRNFHFHLLNLKRLHQSIQGKCSTNLNTIPSFVRPSPSLSSSSSWTPSPSSSSSSTSRRPSLSSSSSAASTWPSPSESVSPKQNQLSYLQSMNLCLVTSSVALYVITVVQLTNKVRLPHPAVTLEVKRRKEKSRTRAFISFDLLWCRGRPMLATGCPHPSLLATCSTDQQLLLSSIGQTKATEKLPMSSSHILLYPFLSYTGPLWPWVSIHACKFLFRYNYVQA